MDWLDILNPAFAVLHLLCIIALIIDMWRLKTGALDRVVWIVALIIFSLLGSMFYLAAHRTNTARVVIPIQVAVLLFAIYVVSAT